MQDAIRRRKRALLNDIFELDGWMTTATVNHDWVTGANAWRVFVEEHPELGYQSGKWGFHNFLRRYREALVSLDTIRLAKGRFWVAHVRRFEQAAFDCATGKSVVK